ncbi:MAG: SUMF1/EgtB/PvdO family nonheme iron enzyme [Nitrospinae bacterium]|nr:SUMF1/EgtB/PvdO family nonheme iron enzyme [Nitrospinota bacterium]
MYRSATWLILLCAALTLLCATTARADYGAGRTAWKAGRHAEALKEWRAAARKGDRRAMLALGRAFVKGLGVPKDFIEAHKWLNLAAARGDAKAAAERDALEKRMTLEEQAEARKLARAWRSAARPTTSLLPRRKAPRPASPPRRIVRKGSLRRAERANAALRAASAGDVSALEKALAAGADPNARGGRSWTPLMYVANKGYTLLVPPLLEAGANPNLRAADGATALFIAALHGHSEIIAALMKAGADPSIKGPRGRTALAVALKKGVSPAVLAFRDCPECPEMVPVPAGSFMMGSPSGEKGRDDDEGPRRRVTISKPFAVGRYEVTFAEWDACAAVDGSGCHRPGDEGWGRGRRPVINVSWDDAQAYVKWLSKKTGERYRLLTEAEWEYAARAGATTRYSWGDDIGHNRANCEGCGSRWDRQTAPVGSFRVNPFGLHDAHGNVWEWVADCWNKNYEGAPSDGRAWTSGDCGSRVLRGGSWSSKPRNLRFAVRGRFITISSRHNNGFRVTRTLDP